METILVGWRGEIGPLYCSYCRSSSSSLVDSKPESVLSLQSATKLAEGEHFMLVEVHFLHLPTHLVDHRNVSIWTDHVPHLAFYFQFQMLK